MCPPHDGTGYTCLPGSLPCKLMVLDTLRDLARGEQITLCTVGELKILSGRSCIFYKTILGQFRYLKVRKEVDMSEKE